MKTYFLSILLVFTSMALSAQGLYNKLLAAGTKKPESNMTFYLDEARTQPIEKLEPGQTEFYAVVPLELRAKDFKLPLGKLVAYTNYEEIPFRAEIKNLSFGHSVSDYVIYYERAPLSGTFADLVGQEDFMFKLKLDDDVNFISNVESILESGTKIFDLEISMMDEDEPFGFGIIKWDISDDGQAFKNADLASRANYTFGATDDVNDPEFKALVKEDIESRKNIVIYQMAHGDRVPYTRNLNHYRRNQIGITYKDLEDGKCYTGGISAFEGGAGPGGPYTYDMQGMLSQGNEIPCDRVDK
jgi:hypothetical protein